MKFVVLACSAAVASAGIADTIQNQYSSGPRFTINVQDPSLPNGVGSLNLEGEYQREIIENLNAGVKYDYNVDRARPSSVWVATSADLDEGVRFSAKAEYNINSKYTTVEGRLERGDDAVSIDYDTGNNVVGPLKIRKTLDLNGRRVTIKPNLNVQDRTGEVVINTEIEADRTTAELTLNHADESAGLEVSYRASDYLILSPAVNLKSGDVSLRVNRALDNGGTLEANVDRRNVDWEYVENSWVVRGNIPLTDTGASSISFKRSVDLA